MQRRRSAVASSSPGFTAGYDPAAGSQARIQSYARVTCSRSAPGDPTTLNYAIRANNGSYASGNQNRARKTGPTRYVNYELYRNSGCSAEWRNTTSRSLLFTLILSGYASSWIDVPYWGCIPAGQNGSARGYLFRYRHHAAPQFTIGRVDDNCDRFFRRPDTHVVHVQPHDATGNHYLQLHVVRSNDKSHHDFWRQLHQYAALYHGTRRHQRYAARPELFAGTERNERHRYRRPTNAHHHWHHGFRTGRNLCWQLVFRYPGTHVDPSY